jgi:hypothetical protein
VIRLTLAAAVALAVMAAAPAPGAKHTRHCLTPRGYEVAERSREAVVLVRKRDGRAYGCLFAVGRHYGVSNAANYTLAGRYVAYDSESFGPDGTESLYVAVRNLRNGHFAHAAPIYKDDAFEEAEAPGAITDLVLKRNGSVAWISCFANNAHRRPCFPSPDPDLPYQVWRADTRGRKMLDASDGVARRSLRRDGSTLSWRHGAETRTATLR